MPQIFHPSFNTIARLSIFGGLFAALGLVGVGYLVIGSPYQTQVGIVRDQPVQFSHEHHARVARLRRQTRQSRPRTIRATLRRQRRVDNFSRSRSVPGSS